MQNCSSFSEMIEFLQLVREFCKKLWKKTEIVFIQRCLVPPMIQHINFAF